MPQFTLDVRASKMDPAGTLTTLGREFMTKVRAAAVAAIAALCALIASGATSQADEVPAYKDASLPVQQRVDDLIERMSLEEKIGQMTQTERYQVFDNEEPIKTYMLGSILSGGGSTPTQNTPKAWADMIDRFQ